MKKTAFAILAAFLVVLFVGAIVLYGQLSKKYTPPFELPTTPEKTAATTSDTVASANETKASETEMTTQPYSATDIIPAQTTSSDSTETAQTTPQKTTAVGTTAPEPVKNTAPDFAVLDENGNTVRLSDKFGKPVVINFWATWCPPCKQELPDFDKLCKEYGDRVVFMMVNLTDGYRDTVDGTKRFVSGKDYTFPVYFDTKDNAASAYNVSSIPQTTFIDANGNIYTTRIGAMNEATLRIYLNALLGN